MDGKLAADRDRPDRRGRASRRAGLAAALLGVTVMAGASLGPAGRADAAQGCRVAPAPEHASASRTAEVGCPTDVASPIEAAEQFFELGVMLWRGDARTVYVLPSQAVGPERTWRAFPDTFYEGQPEAAGHGPPDERLLEPVRGFGKVWREQLGGPHARLGWATSHERRVWAAVQTFERGLVLRTETGRVYVLRDDGSWASIRR